MIMSVANLRALQYSTQNGTVKNSKMHLVSFAMLQSIQFGNTYRQVAWEVKSCYMNTVMASFIHRFVPHHKTKLIKVVYK